jgi:hypothetical protein
MKPTTQPPDEFFPEVLEAEAVQSEHLTVLHRVVPKAEFATYAGTLTDALLEEQSAIEAYVRIRNVSDILEQALGRIKDRAINSMQGTSKDICGAKVQLKARKKLLENLPAEVDDATTGEILYPARFVSGGSTLQITF